MTRTTSAAARAFFIAGTIVTGLGAAAVSAQSPSPRPIAAEASMAGDVVRAQGTFVGDSNHITTGGVTIERQGDVTIVRLHGDFSLDGAPDPKVALGRDGYDAATLMGPLTALNGEQVFVIPANIDEADYNEVWIWCERFSVPLGHADLTRPQA